MQQLTKSYSPFHGQRRGPEHLGVRWTSSVSLSKESMQGLIECEACCCETAKWVTKFAKSADAPAFPAYCAKKVRLAQKLGRMQSDILHMRGFN